MGRIEKVWFTARVCKAWGLGAARKKTNRKPIHVFFALVDHYEPGTAGVGPDVELSRVDSLIRLYPGLAGRHADADGRVPRRTWFFPPHYHRRGSLNRLVELCQQGYGEIELHLHHGKHRPDTPENLRDTILRCVEEYSLFGIFGTHNGAKRYGFIHGDWALDNSRNGRYCGVNNEIDVLRGTGCYADFTHPSLPGTTPKMINRLFYAVGQPDKPKSHATGTPVRTGYTTEGLLLVQGPLHPHFIRPGLVGLRAMGDAINGAPRTTPARIDKWIDAGISVAGRDDWVFVKTHTHGATDGDAVLGEEMDEIFAYLEKTYNDGANYVLHYVTAREMYNVIKAAEAGVGGDDPTKYLDYEVAKPDYRPSVDILEASEELRKLVGRTYW